MSNLSSLFNVVRGWPDGSALPRTFPPVSGTLVEGDVVAVSSSAPVGTAAATTVLDPATAPPADIDVFVDPHAAADFETAAITDDHLLDSTNNANADMVTVPAGNTIFDALAAFSYGGAKTLRGVIGKKRLRTTAAGAFTVARTAQGLTYAVRAALLKSEDPASPYMMADVDAINWANASAIFDMFTDPAAGVDFPAASIVAGDRFDLAHNAVPDWVTLGLNENIFSDGYAAKVVHATEPVISNRRIRTTAATAFAADHTADAVSWFVRPAILFGEDPATPYMQANVDAITWANTSAIFDTFTDPAAGVSFLGVGIVAGDIFDLAHNAVPDWVTLAANQHIFSGNLAPYAGGHVLHATEPVISNKRLRTNAGTAFVADHTADAVSWFVRPPILLAEDPASPYSRAVGGTVDAITWADNGGGLTRITGAGAAEFAACVAGDIAHVTGGATAAHNDGWMIIAVDGAFNWIDINLAFGADAKSGVAGFGCAVYHPDVTSGVAPATVQIAQTITAAGAGGFAGVAVGDMAMVLFGGGTPANIGTWRVSAIDPTDTIVTVTAPVGYALADELVGLTDVVFFHPRESNVATAATVADRGLTRITGAGAAEFATCLAGDVAKVSGGAVADHNGGWRIVNVDAAFNFVDVATPFTADGNTGLAGFQVQVYHPDEATTGMSATAQAGAQTITNPVAGGFLGTVAGDMVCVLASIEAPGNIGTFRVASVDGPGTVITVATPAGFELVDETIGGVDVAIFHVRESNVATAAEVSDRGLTRITGAGAAEFATCVAGDVAAVSGGDTDAHNAGWLIHEVDAAFNYIDIDLPFDADANIGASGFQVQVYHPTHFIEDATAILATQKIVKTGLCAAAAIGDIAMILNTANKGTWYVSAKTANDITLESPAGYGVIDAAVGQTCVALFRPLASRGAASVTVRKRLTRLVDTGATFRTHHVMPAIDDLVMPWPTDVDPTHFDTLTTRWPIETVVSETTLDIDLEELEEIAPDHFIAGYAANAPYRIDLHYDMSEVSKMTSARAQAADGSLNAPDYPWFVIQGNDQHDGSVSGTVACLNAKSGAILTVPFAAANTVDPGDLLYSNAGALTLVTRAEVAIGGSGANASTQQQPVAMVLETNRTAGATGQITVVTV